MTPEEEKELFPLMKDISKRLEEIGKPMTQDEIKNLIDERFSLLKNDKEFIRKMKFRGEDPKLVGTKFARWGITVSELEFLYDLQNSLKGQRKVTNDGDGFYPGPSEELENTFKAVSEAYYISDADIRAIDKRAIDNVYPRVPLQNFSGRDLALAKRGAYELMESYQRAMDTQESGYGQQLVGAQYVGDLWEAARRESVVFSQIRSFEMTAPVAFLPVEVDFPEMLWVPESTANNSAAYATVKTGSQRVQVTAQKFVIPQMWSGELEEDSIIPFLPFIHRQMQLAIAFYSDSLALNGDTTNAATGNINSVDALPAATKHYLAVDGIRHVGLVDNTANSKDMAGAITYAALVAQRGRMIDQINKVDWGHPIQRNDLVRVADPATVDAISLLPEVVTADKYLQFATVLTGEQSRIGQEPLIASMAVPRTDATGKVSATPANNVKGQVIAFNKKGFIAGWRRRAKLEVERLPASDQTRIVMSMRLGFGRFSPSGAASGIEAADVIYNIT